MADEREQFGERLEEILDKQGVTSRQAAESVHCTGATIGRWKRGEVPYCIWQILAGLHREYDIDLNVLVCGEDK